MRQPIYINGRFAEQRPSGVHRYAAQVVRALDSLLSEGQIENQQWILLHSRRAAPWIADLQSITPRRVGSTSGHLWEQTDLPLACGRAPLVNLCNTGPLWRRRQLVVLHDALIYRMPDGFGRRYVAAHKLIDFCVVRRSAQIGTVSEFSRRELSDVLNLSPARIQVLPNGSDHVHHIQPDPGVIDRLGLAPGQYFLFVGNFAANKNLPTLLSAMEALRQQRPEATLVVVGGQAASIFHEQALAEQAGVLFPGRLPDDALMGLYAAAAALVFPSLYEGFGIPPLEALALGTRVVAARIPPVEEVCGEQAHYFDPAAPEELAKVLERLLGALPGTEERNAGKARAQGFSWSATARRLSALAATL